MKAESQISVLAKGTGQIGKFVITERLITVATRIFTDVPMIAFILADSRYGWLKSMVFVTPLYIVVCAAIVFISDSFHARGIDITGIEEMRATAQRADLERRQFVKRFVRWFMARESLIFWIGSWFYLDPDYVTLMLRKKGDSFMKVMVKITIPSVIVSMLVWSTVYWAAYQPFKHAAWARWIADNL